MLENVGNHACRSVALIVQLDLWTKDTERHAGVVKYRKRSLRIFDHSHEGIRSLGKKAHINWSLFL